MSIFILIAWDTIDSYTLTILLTWYFSYIDYDCSVYHTSIIIFSYKLFLYLNIFQEFFSGEYAGYDLKFSYFIYTLSVPLNIQHDIILESLFLQELVK